MLVKLSAADAWQLLPLGLNCWREHLKQAVVPAEPCDEAL